MNLEYDGDELMLLEQVESIFRGLRARAGEPSGSVTAWQRISRAGWSRIGQEVEEGTLLTGLAIGIFRAAGRQLMLDQYVNNAYVLPALCHHIIDDLERERLHQGQGDRPGVVFGDGRNSAVPVVPPEAVEGYCFGLEDVCDIYRIERRSNGTFFLGRIPFVESYAKSGSTLSASVAKVVVPASADWTWLELAVADSDLRRLERAALLCHSAALIGCSEELMAETCSYASVRKQFGTEIGRFQALRHLLADGFACNTVAWNALLAAAADPDDVVSLLAARYLTVKAALTVASTAAQVYGGIGFTSEMPLHEYLATVLNGVQRFGSPEDYEVALGSVLLDVVC